MSILSLTKNLHLSMGTIRMSLTVMGNPSETGLK
jgi:hypothetical protein